MIDFDNSIKQRLNEAANLLAHIPKQIPKVQARAMNRALSSGKTEAAARVRDTYLVRKRDVSETMELKKASANDLDGSLESKGHVMPLIRFRVTPKSPQPGRKKPILAQVLRAGGKSPIPGAFVAKVRNVASVYRRTTPKRFPIKGLYAPAVPQMLDNEKVRKSIQNKMLETLDKRLEHEIGRVLDG
ncbi:phage tail protein [Brevibacillus brevis]|uniref:phage tail protein n=1 Tax=Brevibacillus brevis TaxID=1393 RepID=UPI00363A6B1B